ncbi:MAG: hypothetical protein BGO43_09870 [Gammaproteobacteria bacterium 39-13]|nr:hypothetical protein [Gammaproteobacteria bacterium]OJV89893.1 MAG: hypothetical protein BGO43_09870 [Gammaproteobacteria bacterium 39-13]
MQAGPNVKQLKLYSAICEGKFDVVKALLEATPELATMRLDLSVSKAPLLANNQYTYPILFAIRSLPFNNFNFSIVSLLHEKGASLGHVDERENLNALMIVAKHGKTLNMQQVFSLLSPTEQEEQLQHRAQGNNLLYCANQNTVDKNMLLAVADLYTPEKLGVELCHVNADKNVVLNPVNHRAMDIRQRELAAKVQPRCNYPQLGFFTPIQIKKGTINKFNQLLEQYLAKLMDIKKTPPEVKNGEFVACKSKFADISLFFDEALKSIVAWEMEKLPYSFVEEFKKTIREFESKQLEFNGNRHWTHQKNLELIKDAYNQMLNSAIAAVQFCKFTVIQAKQQELDVPEKKQEEIVAENSVEQTPARKLQQEKKRAPESEPAAVGSPEKKERKGLQQSW